MQMETLMVVREVAITAKCAACHLLDHIKVRLAYISIFISVDNFLCVVVLVARCTDGQAKRALLAAGGDQTAAVKLRQDEDRLNSLQATRDLRLYPTIKFATASDGLTVPPQLADSDEESQRDSGTRESRISIGTIRQAISNFRDRKQITIRQQRFTAAGVGSSGQRPT